MIELRGLRKPRLKGGGCPNYPPSDVATLDVNEFDYVILQYRILNKVVIGDRVIKSWSDWTDVPIEEE